MKTLPLLLTTTLLLTSGAACADGSGTLWSHGQAITLEHAYAFRWPVPLDPGAEVTSVVLADRPIDAAALADASDRGGALDLQLRGATWVAIAIRPDGSVLDVSYQIDESSASERGIDDYRIELKHNDAERIEGRFQSIDTRDKVDGRYYDLRFALDVAGGSEAGASASNDAN
ncbi:MAG: hypothetical protein H3C27_18450 [Opitutaceae bacterium]|nr:hypothetical protein [Opitutaceae bacterium]